MSLFPELTATAILERQGWLWDFYYPLPVPKGDWCRCPICGGEPHAREWRIGPRNKPGDHRLSHRCDVMLKCSHCAHVWAHGLAITREFARAYGCRGERLRVWDWREAQKLLAGHSIEV